MARAYMILDLQFGATGTGQLAGYLAKTKNPDVVVTAWSPYDVRTYIDAVGRKFEHRTLANGVVSPELTSVLIGPGSIIDPEALLSELRSCADLLEGKNLIIHPSAIVAARRLNRHGGAKVRALRLNASTTDKEDYLLARDVLTSDWLASCVELGVQCSLNEIQYANAISQAQRIQIEGSSGHSRSMYHGVYPYTDSRDISPAQELADCAIPYSIRPTVYGAIGAVAVCRSDLFEGSTLTRTAYSDQQEVSWGDVCEEDRPHEKIFTFSQQQMLDGIQHCWPQKLFINFANYISTGELSELETSIKTWSSMMRLDCQVAWIGYGPTHNDILERGQGEH